VAVEDGHFFEGKPVGEVGTSYIFGQLGYSAPVLFAYLVATFLAIFFMGRAPVPSILTLLGVGVMVFATLGVVVAQAVLLESGQRDVRDPSEFAQLMVATGVAGNCVRALGLGLLIAAVFVGRTTATFTR
jgi:hypothetical protein